VLRIRIRDPGSRMSLKERSGSESLETIFWVKKALILFDLGSGFHTGWKNLDPRSVINIPDPQHCLEASTEDRMYRTSGCPKKSFFPILQKCLFLIQL
jgi:hypothetical protein